MQLSLKHSAILTAAISQFAQYGLAASTMEKIASEAEVSKRTLYKHFSSKEALFDTVVDLLIERIEPLVAIQFVPNYAFKPQLQHLAKSAAKLLSDDDYLTLSRIVMIESMRSRTQAEKLAERFVNCECALAQWFYDASQEGCLGHYDPELAAGFFWGSLKKLTYWEQVLKWKMPLDEEALEKLIEQTVKIFCDGITPRQ